MTNYKWIFNEGGTNYVVPVKDILVMSQNDITQISKNGTPHFCHDLALENTLKIKNIISYKTSYAPRK